MIISMRDLLRGEELSLNQSLAVTPDIAAVLSHLKKIEVISYRIEMGKYSRDSNIYKVSLTERAKTALKLARK